MIAACGVRAPAPIDVGTLVRTRGETEARRDLAIRVIGEPRDVQARLALAALDDKLGFPSDAIEQLDAVVMLGGPAGTRWHGEDRARLARLILARGRERLARRSEAALADLQRARELGASVAAGELATAREVAAVAELRHVDAKVRARGRDHLATLLDGPGARPAWRGARADATPAEHGAFGDWLWEQGAYRESYEHLERWHRATRRPRDEALQAAYLRALAWWSPVWLGEVPPPPADELVGPGRCWFPNAGCTPPKPELVLAPVEPYRDARSAAIIRYARARVTGGPDPAALLPIVDAFGRDPAIAERLGRDLVARATDAAVAHAAVGAVFDVLGDFARSRVEWQAAADQSAEPAFERGLSLAAARAGDPDAALIFATKAAAASGDPAVVWLALARALEGIGRHVEALVAARNAIDLAGPDVVQPAIAVAIAASQALGRANQVDALIARSRRGPEHGAGDVPAALAEHRSAPTQATIARLWVASRTQPHDVESRVALAAALEPDDPRRATITTELVALAGDPDDAIGLAAVAALRQP
ncbi:MAG: repeat-containing protein [Myxococcales bacterium]|nr:repeat-containing protein [Myxococcales bacterium]